MIYKKQYDSKAHLSIDIHHDAYAGTTLESDDIRQVRHFFKFRPVWFRGTGTKLPPSAVTRTPYSALWKISEMRNMIAV